LPQGNTSFEVFICLLLLTRRDTSSEAIRTLLVYGYVLEPPAGEPQDAVAATSGQTDIRAYRVEKTYTVSGGKWCVPWGWETVAEYSS
jgi:hypothetical protein